MLKYTTAITTPILKGKIRLEAFQRQRSFEQNVAIPLHSSVIVIMCPFVDCQLLSVVVCILTKRLHHYKFYSFIHSFKTLIFSRSERD